MAKKPIPRPYQDSKPYWDAAKQGRLVLQQCRDCAKPQFYPRGVCSHCLSSNFDWIEASGRGVVHSFTVCHRAPHPGFAGEVPFVLAIIELAEGVRMMSNVVGCDPKTVRIDMPVKAVFEPAGDDITLPKFTPT
jgi:uncharacterized OB-fold protein